MISNALTKASPFLERVIRISMRKISSTHGTATLVIPARFVMMTSELSTNTTPDSPG